MQIDISPKAKQALGKRTQPLNLEMELYFSCLIRKRVLYPEQPHADAQTLASPHPQLNLFFRPVMTRACSIAEVENAPDLEAFPIQRSDRFQPKWLKLNYRNGQWQGEFGYA